jgi:hypothetical protein
LFLFNVAPGESLVKKKAPEFPKVEETTINEDSWNFVFSCTQLLHKKNVLKLLKKAQDLYCLEVLLREQIENPFVDISTGM